MRFLNRLFRRRSRWQTTGFEEFLKSLGREGVADGLISETRASHRLETALCFGALHGGYKIAEAIRETIHDQPSLRRDGSEVTAQFDKLSQECIALVLFTMMAEHLADKDDDEDEDEDEDSEINDAEADHGSKPIPDKLGALRAALYFADGITQKFMPDRPKELFSNRVRAYSFCAYKQRSILESAAHRILDSASIPPLSLERIGLHMAIQMVLISGVLEATKRGADDLYEAYKANPNLFDK
jgi:hypothetical protein